MTTIIEPQPDGAILLRVKAVPGARRDAIAGPLGDRLKVRVSAPPEGGRANAAICAMVAAALGVRQRDVEVVSGRSAPEKSLRVRGAPADAAARLGV
ncbi:MAG: DUF167 domain-containing protein [Phycisphaerales bacterium]|nr:MAG: DUF167 domain-containing protein [Phycisphaerales bacterium]